MKDVRASTLDRDSSRIQLVEADPDVQAYGHVTPELLKRRLKAHALLGDTILLGGTHVLKSELTYQVLKQVQPLLEAGVIVPTTSTAHDGWDDMIDRKTRSPERYGPMWTSNDAFSTDENSLYRRVSALRGADQRIQRDISEMRNIYSTDLKTELADDDSPLTHEVSKEMDPDRLRRQLEQTDHSSRKFVVERSPAPIRNRLKYHSDLSYHLTGSAAHRAIASFHPWDFHPEGSHFDRAIQRITKNGKPVYQVADGDSMWEDGTTILTPQYTDGWHIAALITFTRLSETLHSLVDGMDCETILELREDRVTRDLHRKLYDVVEALSNNQGGYAVAHELWESEREFQLELQNALAKAYDDEDRRLKRMHNLFSNDLSTGTGATLATSVAVSELAKALLNTHGLVDRTAVIAASLGLRYWLSSNALPALTESRLHDFETEYEAIVSR